MYIADELALIPSSPYNYHIIINYFQRNVFKRGQICLYCTNFDFNRESMQVRGVCINNSSLKLTPFSGCKFHALLQKHGRTSSDPGNSTGV